MIAIGDDTWDESDDYDEPIVVTVSNKHVSNGHDTAQIKEDNAADTLDFFTFEDLQTLTIQGNLDAVKTIMASGEFDVNCPLSSCWTLLMYALESAHVSLVEHYLNLGADVNYHYQMFYPLMACFNKPYLPQENVAECVALLIAREVKVNVHDKHHVSPLMMCARHGYNAALQILLKANVDVNKQDQRGWTALMYAAEANHRSSIDILREHRATIYERSHDEQLTAADIAYSCGHQKLYEYLERMMNPGQDTFKAPCSVVEQTSYKQEKSIDTFLMGIDCGSLIPLFKQQEIDFVTLLTMSSKDLERAGVSQLGVQQKILEGIKGVHGCEWEMPDQSRILFNLELSCGDFSKAVKVYTKHLKYLTATSQYLLGQARDSSKMEKEYPTNAVEDSGLLEKYETSYTVSRTLAHNVEEIGTVLEEKIGERILEREEEKQSVFGIISGCVGVVGLAVGALIGFTVARKPGLFQIDW